MAKLNQKSGGGCDGSDSGEQSSGSKYSFIKVLAFIIHIYFEVHFEIIDLTGPFVG